MDALSTANSGEIVCTTKSECPAAGLTFSEILASPLRPHFGQLRTGRRFDREAAAMSNIVLLFICLAIGILLRKSGRAPENTHVALNTFIIYVSLPSLTLLQLHDVRWQPSLLYAVAMPWILF